MGVADVTRHTTPSCADAQRHFYTSHHDPDHCFEETRDGTLKVTVYGDWLPRHVFGYLHAVCAYVRMIYLAFAVLIVTGSEYPVMHVDQVSCCLPVLRWFGSAKIIFYCHFPDQLLAQRRSALKRFYRAPLDWLEEWTTGMADSILVSMSIVSASRCVCPCFVVCIVVVVVVFVVLIGGLVLLLRCGLCLES